MFVFAFWSQAAAARLLLLRGDPPVPLRRLYVVFKNVFYPACTHTHTRGDAGGGFDLAATRVGDYSGAPPCV